METNYRDIAAKQLNGKASPAEMAKLEQWLAKSTQNEAAYQEQKRIWQLTSPSEAEEVDTDAAWLKVKSQLTQKPETKVIPMYSKVWRVAASVILLIGMMWLMRYYLFPNYGMEVIESGDSPIAVVLPDKSQVWLNKGSKLLYDKEFDDQERIVQLEGEAFFQVHRDTSRPFIILSNRAKTQVLGTSFNLRAYPNEPLIELAVATGKVSFRDKDNKTEEVILTPGFAATLNTKHQAITRTTFTEENAWAWKTGKLHFQNEGLANVLTALERYYDVKLELHNSSVGNCQFTGTFQHTALEEVLQVLEATLQLKYTQQEKQHYTLSGQGCN
jgi:transmembrane sensor